MLALGVHCRTQGETMIESKTLTYFATGGRSADYPWLRFMARTLNGVAVGQRGEILYVNLS